MLAKYNRLTVTIPATEVTKEITVALEEVVINDNRSERIYDVLDRAYIRYDLKKDIWRMIRREKENSRTVLIDTEVDETVKECLLEVL